MKRGDLVRAIEIHNSDDNKTIIPLQVFDGPPDWRKANTLRQIYEVTHEHPLFILCVERIQYGKHRKKVLWARVVTPFGTGWVNTLELEPI